MKSQARNVGMSHYPNHKGEFKTKRVETRWYPSELEQIDRQARAARLTRTEYITKCVLKKDSSKPHVFKVNWRTYQVMGTIAREINRIGNNLNQIAKIFNTERLEGGKIPSRYPLPEELSAFREYVGGLEQELNQLRLLIIGKRDR
ncbi:MAG: plasmid mobilization relaxosome protein MobC [Cyanobacteria bacterium J06621_8]